MANNNKGLQNLARVLDQRMAGRNQPDTVLDFGEITKSYELETTVYPVPIPKDDYQVCRQLTLGNKDEVLCRVSDGNEAYIPEKMRKLKPGDRVLVAWVREEPVVVDIVVRADKM